MIFLIQKYNLDIASRETKLNFKFMNTKSQPTILHLRLEKLSKKSLSKLLKHKTQSIIIWALQSSISDSTNSMAAAFIINPYGQNFQTPTAVNNQSRLIIYGSGIFIFLFNTFIFTVISFYGPRLVNIGSRSVFFITGQDEPLNLHLRI